MTKGMEKTNETLVEEQGLCPSMYSFHSSPDEKNKLLHTLTQYGLETTVDRCAKKDRIRKWIENSVIVEEENEEEVEEDHPLVSLRTQTIKNISSEKERHRRHHSRRLKEKEKEYKPPVDPRIPLDVQKNQFSSRTQSNGSISSSNRVADKFATGNSTKVPKKIFSALPFKNVSIKSLPTSSDSAISSDSSMVKYQSLKVLQDTKLADVREQIQNKLKLV